MNFFNIKTTLFCLALLIFCALSVDGAQAEKAGTAADVKKELSDTVRAIRDFTISQKKELAEKVRTSLEAIDRKIEKMEADTEENWDKMDQATREKSKRTLDALKKKRKTVEAWFDRLIDRSSEEWERAKKGLADKLRELEKALKETDKQPEDKKAAGKWT